MSATLFCEGSNLESVLAEIGTRHDAPTHVVAMEEQRQGGVLGFFARRSYGVTYEVEDYGIEDIGAPDQGPLVDLIDAAEQRDTVTSAASTREHADFAATLLAMAADRRAEAAISEPMPEFLPSVYASAAAISVPGRPVDLDGLARRAQLAARSARSGNDPDSIDAWSAEPLFAEPVGATVADSPAPAAKASTAQRAAASIAAEPSRAAEPARAAETATTAPIMITARPADVIPDPVEPAAPAPASVDPSARETLARLGVPTHLIGTSGVLSEIRRLVSERPAAPPVPTLSGQILLIVGPVVAARMAGRAVAEALGACDPVVLTGTRADALAHGAALRMAATAGVAVLPTDKPIDAAAVRQALGPTATWACVDARHKTEDVAVELADLGPVDALVVHSASRSTTPASVWEHAVPIAALDQRPATAKAWLALLLDRLDSVTG